MFSDSANYPMGHDASALDQHQSKELGRYIAASRKKNLVIHSLLHNRCKFCVNSFSSTGCRNCCLPMCQDFKKVSTKKLLRNTAHNINLNGSGRVLPKKLARSGVYSGQTFLDAPLSNPSPRLSPSLSVRNFVASRATSNLSVDSTSPLPVDLDANELVMDKMNLKESHSSVNGSRIDLPSAPSPGLVLFNNEEQSDVVFLVGKDVTKLWRFPAHSFILVDASSYFKAIVTSPVDNRAGSGIENREIRVNWCEPDTFHAILKYVYTSEVTIKSVSSAMSLFNAANSFCLVRLASLCLTFLCSQCNDENVLEVMSFFHSYLRHLCDQTNTNEIKVAKEGEKSAGEGSDKEDLLEVLNRLIIRCYGIIDWFAPKILSSEEFANLNGDLVGNILWRDTLNVSSELEVFAAINHWACQQCKKCCKELTDTNKRSVLGDLVFYTRYLTMSMDDFMKGPFSNEILSVDEKQALLEHIKSDGDTPLPEHMPPFKMNVERHYEDIYDEEDEEDLSTATESVGEQKQESKACPQNKANATPRKKKKSKSKKILSGIGLVVLCVIKLLD